MHMLSRKDLSKTLGVSRNPTKVITAEGEVQTNEAATVCVSKIRIYS